MKTHTSLPTTQQPPVALTIGNFDGVHQGHKKLLDSLINRAKELGIPSCAITFSNHPATILGSSGSPALICTQEHKKRLLTNAGINQLYMIPFTKEISQQSPQEFIDALRNGLPFHALVLGSDATIGKDRQGTQDVMQALAKQHGFSLEYIPDESIQGQRISSRRIRESIQKGDLDEAARLLGRPYSIFGEVIKGGGRGGGIGFHTANIDVEGLCLPPLGVYAVVAHWNGHNYPGVANLGIAPTIKNAPTPVLEVHVFDNQLDLYGHTVDVEFRKFLRPERRFDSVEALKTQIGQDVAAAKKLF